MVSMLPDFISFSSNPSDFNIMSDIPLEPSTSRSRSSVTPSSILTICQKIQQEVEEFSTVAAEYGSRKQKAVAAARNSGTKGQQTASTTLSYADRLHQLTWSGAPSRRIPEMGQFKKALKGEINALEKIIRKPIIGQTTGDHDSWEDRDIGYDSELEDRLQSASALSDIAWSNQPYLSAVWATAKRSLNITHMPRPSQMDIIADDGLLWIKVSAAGNKRMIYDLSASGYADFGVSYTDDDDDDDDGDYASDEGGDGSRFTPRTYRLDGSWARNPCNPANVVPPIPLVKAVAQMCCDARSVKIRGHHPRIQLVLTRLQPSLCESTEAIVNSLLKLGTMAEPHIQISVETADRPSRLEGSWMGGEGSSGVIVDPPASRELFSRMLPSPIVSSSLTSTINMDCSVLLAIISDLSHEEPDVIAQSGTAKDNAVLNHQIGIEKGMNLMPVVLWPAMKGRNMVCTSEAAEKLFEIVETMGTDTEIQRTRVLFGRGLDGSGGGHDSAITAEQMRLQFQALSRHAVPTIEDWRLPITIVSPDEQRKVVEVLEAQFPQIIAELEPHLVFPNRSVFLYGWAARLATLTSNQAAVGVLHRVIEPKLRDRFKFEWRENQDDDSMSEDGMGMSDSDDDDESMKDTDGGSLLEDTVTDSFPVSIEDFWGPNVWISATARSLVAKEKTRRDVIR